MQRIALILIALFARSGTSWAQSSGLESYLVVARSMSLNDAARTVALDSLTSISLRALNSHSKSVPLADNALRVESPDGSFALVSLNAPLGDGSYAYRGLVGRSDSQKGWTWSILADESWPGAIVYRIVHTRYRRRNYYLTLWYKPHQNGIQEKGIEPVILTRSRLVFGARVFAVKSFNDEVFKKPPERLVLRYGPMATVALRPEKSGVILVEEVAPVRDAPKGQYRYYGPTAVQNRLIFSEGKWRFETLP